MNTKMLYEQPVAKVLLVQTEGLMAGFSGFDERADENWDD